MSMTYNNPLIRPDHFKQIYDRFGAVQVALIPIGAYLPRWFMRDNHLSPAEALDAAATLQSDVMIPMHFGTFALGDDGQDQPLVDLLGAYRPASTTPAFDTTESQRPELHETTNILTPGIELRVLDNGQSTKLTW